MTRTRVEASVVESLLTQTDRDLLLRLEQEAVRIPSLTFEESECAKFFAEAMGGVGLGVELMEVRDPFGSGRGAQQPIGCLPGTGGGASIMLNGHMDHVPVVGAWDRDPFGGDFEDGYIYGRGAHDDKGGIVAAIGALAAIRAAGVCLRGDVYVCPVMGHKSGGIGTRALLARGIRPDYCINTESTGLSIVRVSVGAVKFLVHAYAKPIHFTQSAQVRAQWMNPFEQLASVMHRLGPSMQTIRPGGWLTFLPHEELPDYPQLKYDDMVGGFAATNRATLEGQIRLVPGQTLDAVRGDLERVLQDLSREAPNLNCELEVPPSSGGYAGWDFPPYCLSPSASLVTSLSWAHKLASGDPPVVGTGPRLGAVGDANILSAHGVESIQYGPGTSQEYTQWPTPNERVRLEDLVIAAKAMALTIVDLCQ